MSTLYAFGLGVGTKNSHGDWLEIFYANPLLTPEASITDIIKNVFGDITANQVIEPTSQQLAEYQKACSAQGFEQQAKIANVLATSQRPIVATIVAQDTAPSSVPEGYLKLQLLSHRLVKPHETNLTGLFGVLPNVAWTNQGAIDITELNDRQLTARVNNETLLVHCVDKFPPMTHYVVPQGIRIGDTSRVRLGAHIGEGTTVMHEGFVNFNAGTIGPNMIEGRISAGVTVGKGSDLGGGCSTMGTLSGGGDIVISVGEECLLGANAGIGIPLGNRCTVEAGLYITAGTKVHLLDKEGKLSQVVKARDLANKDDLLLRRNSVNGQVECHTNKTAIALNEELHVNN